MLAFPVACGVLLCCGCCSVLFYGVLGALVGCDTLCGAAVGIMRLPVRHYACQKLCLTPFGLLNA
eukprot:11194448-Lingulodinium_polyedra.AAC.1